jgi:hypothetical protein
MMNVNKRRSTRSILEAWTRAGEVNRLIAVRSMLDELIEVTAETRVSSLKSEDIHGAKTFVFDISDFDIYPSEQFDLPKQLDDLIIGITYRPGSDVGAATIPPGDIDGYPDGLIIIVAKPARDLSGGFTYINNIGATIDMSHSSMVHELVHYIDTFDPKRLGAMSKHLKREQEIGKSSNEKGIDKATFHGNLFRRFSVRLKPQRLRQKNTLMSVKS